jgi:zeta-carotene desaturase
MASVIVVGGGLAGLAATAALAEAGYDVELFESKPFLGGRATSYDVNFGDGRTELIDNCQHILLRCCTNLLDFYRRLGVHDRITFYRQFYFVEPGGRVSVLGRGVLPFPLHFTGSFLELKFLDLREKAALSRAIGALLLRSSANGLDDISMAEWLRTQRQPPRVVEHFWRQVLVSAVNAELDDMAASNGFQVMRLAFFGDASSHEMGVPDVGLGELVEPRLWLRWPNVRVNLRAQVQTVDPGHITINGERRPFDFCVVAVPWHRINALAPAYDTPPIGPSSITGIHLWFDRSVTDLPHATLLDRTLHWVFNKGAGRHLSLLVSASQALERMDRREVIELAHNQIAQFFPRAANAQLERAHVVKEVRATIAPRPGLNAVRPGPATPYPNVFVAGDWTRTGWPSTMEGAVRSGYLAAEAVTAASGRPRTFLVPDVR